MRRRRDDYDWERREHERIAATREATRKASEQRAADLEIEALRLQLQLARRRAA